jgi:hypothetical protein
MKYILHIDGDDRCRIEQQGFGIIGDVHAPEISGLTELVNKASVHDDLLDALENMLGLFDFQGDHRPYTWQERLPLILAARSAIAKGDA